MSELLKLYRNAQRPYEKLIRYCAIAPVGILPYYDGLLDQYSEADQIFVKRVLELEAKYSALTARIAEFEEKQRWIPVSERLPETDGQYIGYTNTGLVGTHWLVDGHFAVTYYCEQKWLTTPTSWILESASGGDVYVTHWMPLPTPPEVQE